jgi:hypothetical protein
MTARPKASLLGLAGNLDPDVQHSESVGQEMAPRFNAEKVLDAEVVQRLPPSLVANTRDP